MKIIKDFEKLPYESYEKNRSKYEPTDSYFYLSRQLEKCTMRSDSLKSHSYPVRTEMTALSLYVYSMDEGESKGIIVQKTLSQSFSTEEEKSKVIIFNTTLLKSCSTDKYE